MNGCQNQTKGFKTIEICGRTVWIHADPQIGTNDAFIARGPLNDEYQVDPIAQGGHQIEWVLDIGAFVGTFTMKVKSLWPKARVIAIEPAAETACLYRLNTQDLTRIFFYEAAAVRRGQSKGMHLSFDNMFPAARRVKEVVEQFGHVGIIGEPIKAMALLEILHAHDNPAIGILKIDAEGVEADLLEDLREAGYLERIVWIRGEWHYHQSIPRIKAALADTHVFNIEESNHPWGAFIAHRKG